MNSLMQVRGPKELIHRVKVAGVLTCYDDNNYFIQDDSGSVMAIAEQEVILNLPAGGWWTFWQNPKNTNSPVATTLTAGNYFLTDYADAPRTDLLTGIGNFTASGSSFGGTFTQDKSENDGTLIKDESMSGTLTIDSTGLVTLVGAGAWGYVISPTRLAVINPSASNTNPDIEIFQQ